MPLPSVVQSLRSDLLILGMAVVDYANLAVAVKWSLRVDVDFLVVFTPSVVASTGTT